MEAMKSLIEKLGPFDEDNNLNVIIETPMGCRNKYSYDPGLRLFQLKKALPVGMVFPFDFGFVPSTVGGDGDPLDVLVITEEAAFPGCLIHAHLLGVVEAEQKTKRETERNDRLVAAAMLGAGFSEEELPQLDATMMKQIEQFFVSYSRLEGKEFKVLSQGGPKKARKLVLKAQAQFEKARKKEK
jgi:inorganic pyrophosphatase